MTRRQKIEELVSRILMEKERIDCEHIKRTARHGCMCRRCKNARKVLTGGKPRD